MVSFMDTIKAVTCRRCKYQWVPHSLNKPTRCANPKCRSPYWDQKPRKKRKVK